MFDGKMSEITVSVLMPDNNAPKTIRKALDSALAQSVPAHEIIIVDDGSTDDLQDVLRDYGERVRCLHQPNRGAASARNRGIDAASGEVIAFLDADDYW